MNILTVNFNTGFLIEAILENLKKFGKDFYLYIIENSTDDAKSFKNAYNDPRCTIIKNNDKQYVDWNVKAPDDKFGGSFIHSCCIQKFYEDTDEPFLLLDSDALLKIDYNALRTYKCAKGQICGNRLLPMILYVNVPLCKKENINFFDYKTICPYSNADTGTSFLNECRKKQLIIDEIKLEDVGFHLGANYLNPEHRLKPNLNYSFYETFNAVYSTEEMQQRFLFRHRDVLNDIGKVFESCL